MTSSSSMTATEGAKSGRVTGIPLHPFITGLAFRIKYLDKGLEYFCGDEGVWPATGWEIADWFYRHYYERRAPKPTPAR